MLLLSIVGVAKAKVLITHNKSLVILNFNTYWVKLEIESSSDEWNIL